MPNAIESRRIIPFRQIIKLVELTKSGDIVWAVRGQHGNDYSTSAATKLGDMHVTLFDNRDRCQLCGIRLLDSLECYESDHGSHEADVAAISFIFPTRSGSMSGTPAPDELLHITINDLCDWIKENTEKSITYDTAEEAMTAFLSIEGGLR